MRLTKYEVKVIKNSFDEIFEGGEIYLFGSRVDDAKKGGDIDLFLDLKNNLNMTQELDKKSRFKIELEDKLGEQKIDVVISKNKERLIEKEALKHGIRL
mgnify:CR=1 FL=1